MVVAPIWAAGTATSTPIFGIKQAGISCVIAESFDRNFFKNSINLGLPIIELEGINKNVKAGDNSGS